MEWGNNTLSAYLKSAGGSAVFRYALFPENQDGAGAAVWPLRLLPESCKSDVWN